MIGYTLMAIPKVQWASRIHYLISIMVRLLLLLIFFFLCLLIHLRQIISCHIKILLLQYTFVLLFHQILNLRIYTLLLRQMIRSFSLCSLVIWLSSRLWGLLEKLMTHQLLL